MVLVHEMTSSYDWWMTVRTAIVWNFETGRAMKAGKEPENSQLRVFSILYFLDGWLVRWSVGLQRAFWLRDKPSLLIRLVLLAGLNPDASKNGPPQSKNGTEKFTSILFSPWILKSFFIFLHLFPPSCFFCHQILPGVSEVLQRGYSVATWCQAHPWNRIWGRMHVRFVWLSRVIFSEWGQYESIAVFFQSPLDVNWWRNPRQLQLILAGFHSKALEGEVMVKLCMALKVWMRLKRDEVLSLIWTVQ